MEVCDICRRDYVLTTCRVCGRQFCLMCDALIPGCWVKPEVCKLCGKREDVQAVVQRYAKRITPIIKQRETALARLPVADTDSDSGKQGL